MALMALRPCIFHTAKHAALHSASCRASPRICAGGSTAAQLGFAGGEAKRGGSDALLGDQGARSLELSQDGA